MAYNFNTQPQYQQQQAAKAKQLNLLEKASKNGNI